MKRLISACVPALATLFLLLSFGRVSMAATTYSTPTNSEFKAYMDYRKITNKGSKAYKLQLESETDENGLRIYDGRYCVAVGTFFDAPVGTYIDVTLTTGVTLHCVVGDIKQNAHTDERNMQCSNGNIVEFIVDTPHMDSACKHAGSMHKLPGFEGGVSSITVFDKADILEVSEIREVQEIKEVELGDTTVAEVSYEGESDVSSVYVDTEVFETEVAAEETFVTYSPEDEVIFVY